MFQIKKVESFIHPCLLRQMGEDGSVSEATLRVRFKHFSREALDALVAEANEDDLLFDLVVLGIVDTVADADGNALTPDAALAAIRSNLPLSNQIVAQFWECISGAAAKNAKRSRGR